MGQSIFQSSPEFAGANEGARVGTLVVGGGGGALPNEENSTQVGAGGGVAEEHRRWGPVVWPAARAVFCMGRIRDEEEEGLGDIGSSSNCLKWSRDSWELQNWHQGIECHSGCNETHTLPAC